MIMPHRVLVTAHHVRFMPHHVMTMPRRVMIMPHRVMIMSHRVMIMPHRGMIMPHRTCRDHASPCQRIATDIEELSLGKHFSLVIRSHPFVGIFFVKKYHISRVLRECTCAKIIFLSKTDLFFVPS